MTRMDSAYLPGLNTADPVDCDFFVVLDRSGPPATLLGGHITAIGGLRVANRLHGNVWRAAQTLFNEGVVGDVTDEQLLERFVTAHREVGELAFEALVDRHGPMVLRICRAVLPDEHDAEDAFQATFLVLARQAASIRSRSSVASWLHGVARRVACCARSAASRRLEHERNAAVLAQQFVDEPRSDDLAQVLHEEIDQLPERFRAPIVLCYMQGLTEGQTARRLGRPVGTIRSRLTRGKQRLRCQLIRRGLAPASVVLIGRRQCRTGDRRLGALQFDDPVRDAFRSGEGDDGWDGLRRRGRRARGGVSGEHGHGQVQEHRDGGIDRSWNSDGRCIRIRAAG